MSAGRPLAAGTVLSLGVVCAIAGLDPGPARWPPISARHLWAAYWALAAAPSGNGPALFALVAFIYAACFFVAAWRRSRRQHVRRRSG